MFQDRIDKFKTTYQDLYNDGKSSILHLQNLGLNVPYEFKLAAAYTLSRQLKTLFLENKNDFSENIIKYFSKVVNKHLTLCDN